MARRHDHSPQPAPFLGEPGHQGRRVQSAIAVLFVGGGRDGSDLSDDVAVDAAGDGERTQCEGGVGQRGVFGAEFGVEGVLFVLEGGYVWAVSGGG